MLTCSSEPGASVSDGSIPLSAPEISGNEWRYVKECLDTGWVSSVGPFVERFERELAAYVGVKYAVAMVNGTAALHTALQVIGLRPGEEVIVSNLTFIASVNAIHYAGAHPVLMDAHPETWQIDPDKVERFLATECERRNDGCYNRKTGRRVRAILPVHILGLACEIERILDLARRFRLQVVEDAAEALGVRYRKQHVGTFGGVGVFSFNGNKIITAGGGGMLVTNNPTYAERARYLSTQARDNAIEYIHNEVGYNYRLSSIQAAVAVAQLERLEEFIEKKRAIAHRYEENFIGLKGITPMPSPPYTEPTYWLYTILLDEVITLAKRQEIVRELNQSGIGARSFWHPIHDLPPYRDCQAFEIEASVSLYERGVSLPCSVGLTAGDQQRCIDAIKQKIAK